MYRTMEQKTKMGLEKTHRYYVAIYGDGSTKAQWYMCPEFANDAWPESVAIIDATEMPDDQFEALFSD